MFRRRAACRVSVVVPAVAVLFRLLASTMSPTSALLLLPPWLAFDTLVVTVTLVLFSALPMLAAALPLTV